MERRCHGWLVGVVAALALGAFAPAASAATANITDDGTTQVLHFDAAAGEVNNLWIEGGPQWQVAELQPAGGGTPVHITGDANCHAYPPPGDPIGADAVSCDTPDGLGGIDRVEINLGDGNDHIQIIAADVPIVVNGGDGDDSFEDTDRTNVALPVPRTFNGGLGDDRFIAGIDSGQPNDYHGDDGVDKMYYHWRSDSTVKRSQTITLDNLADDGENNEGDNVHSDIEYAIGSDQADVIKGTANDDYLVGMGGADKIDGLGGKDRVFADDSSDTGQKICDADVLNGGEGDDELTLGGNTTANGEAGDDTIRSFPVTCAGGDVATGGDGQDTASFFDLPDPAPVVKGLKASLDGVANDGVGSRSNFAADIEIMYANSGGMTLIGNDQANRLNGGKGDDVLDGRGGADVLGGGLGTDTADYSSRSEPLNLTLDGVANDGAPGENDLIRDDVENVRGGSGGDTIVGDALDNVLDGGPGADNISGGDGVDAVDYSRRTAALNVTLNTGAGNDGEAGENDTIAADVEGAFGGAGNDTLVGAVGNGFLFGFGGNDDLRDVGGVDTLDAGTGDDAIDSVDGAVDHDVCGPGTDKVTKDANDTVDADCADTTTPPVDPPTDPPSTPPTTPPTTPPVTPPVSPPVVPIDHTAPNATLALGAGKLGKLLSSGLKVSVKSNEAGSVGAVLTAESNTVRLLKRHGVKGVLASGRGTATGGATKTLTLRLGRKARKALRGAAVAKLKLVVTVIDGAGNRRTLTKHLKIKG
jgi:Ca2+-binding RTX toxin-like protein